MIQKRFLVPSALLFIQTGRWGRAKFVHRLPYSGGGVGANGIIGDQDILPQRNVNPEVAGSNPASANFVFIEPQNYKENSLSLK